MVMDGQKDKKRMIVRGIVTLAGLVISVGLLWLSQTVDGFANAYVKNIYPLWIKTVGRFFGIFPFSVIEIILYALVLAVIFVSVRGLIRAIRKHRFAWMRLFGAGLGLTALAAVLLLIYVLNCGINYSADSFSETYGFVRRGYTPEQLSDVCRRLTDEVAECYEAALLGQSEADWPQMATAAMEKLGQHYPMLDLSYPRPKALIVSELLSFQQLSGIYSPFTAEANYNADMLPYNIPFTMCHELSHLSGFMQEDEANFIAWLACMNADAAAFRYSGAVMGWIYCTNELYKADQDLYNALYTKLPQAVQLQLQENNDFWQKYKGKVADAAQKVNDTYLKAHRQSEGIKTYDRVTDLIVNVMIDKE